MSKLEATSSTPVPADTADTIVSGVPATRGSGHIQFGSCVVDVEARQLFVDGHERHVTPKAFELLIVLAHHAPKALTKGQLINHLWPRTHVSDDALSHLVADLRTAIGDTARSPRWIRTVHGYGYAFLNDVTETAVRSPSACSLTWGSREFRLSEGDNVIGRGGDVDVLMTSQLVSRRHACITLTSGTPRIEDLGSKNGTSVGGLLIAEPCDLHHGDIVTLGDVELTFQMAADAPTVTR